MLFGRAQQTGVNDGTDIKGCLGIASQWLSMRDQFCFQKMSFLMNAILGMVGYFVMVMVIILI